VTIAREFPGSEGNFEGYTSYHGTTGVEQGAKDHFDVRTNNDAAGSPFVSCSIDATLPKQEKKTARVCPGLFSLWLPDGEIETRK
jgi:hypothetical protein